MGFDFVALRTLIGIDTVSPLNHESRQALNGFLGRYNCRWTGGELFERLAPDAKIVLYAQADTKPPNPSSEWRTDPFKMIRDGDRLMGLGISDSKFQLLNALVSAEEEDLHLVVDTMEESGGREARRRIEQLDPDMLIVVDGSADEIGSCYDAMVGQLDGSVTLTTGKTPRHPARAKWPGIAQPLYRLLDRLHSLEANPTITGLQCTPTERSLSIEDLEVRLDVRFEQRQADEVLGFWDEYALRPRQFMYPLTSAQGAEAYAPFSGWLGGAPLRGGVLVVPGGLAENGNHRPNEWIFDWQPDRHLEVLRTQVREVKERG